MNALISVCSIVRSSYWYSVATPAQYQWIWYSFDYCCLRELLISIHFSLNDMVIAIFCDRTNFSNVSCSISTNLLKKSISAAAAGQRAATYASVQRASAQRASAQRASAQRASAQCSMQGGTGQLGIPYNLLLNICSNIHRSWHISPPSDLHVYSLPQARKFAGFLVFLWIIESIK